jgi:hypothetical protein
MTARKEVCNWPICTEGTSDTGNDLKYPKKLLEKEEDCCVCNKWTKHGKGNRNRLRTGCAKCSKGPHGQCFLELNGVSNIPVEDVYCFPKNIPTT